MSRFHINQKERYQLLNAERIIQRLFGKLVGQYKRPDGFNSDFGITTDFSYSPKDNNHSTFLHISDLSTGWDPFDQNLMQKWKENMKISNGSPSSYNRNVVIEPNDKRNRWDVVQNGFGKIGSQEVYEDLSIEDAVDMAISITSRDMTMDLHGYKGHTHMPGEERLEMEDEIYNNEVEHILREGYQPVGLRQKTPAGDKNPVDKKLGETAADEEDKTGHTVKKAAETILSPTIKPKGESWMESQNIKEETPLIEKWQRRMFRGEAMAQGVKDVDGFVEFMTRAFPREHDQSYISNWARRWRNGTAHGYSDGEVRTILEDMGYNGDKPRGRTMPGEERFEKDSRGRKISSGRPMFEEPDLFPLSYSGDLDPLAFNKRGNMRSWLRDALGALEKYPQGLTRNSLGNLIGRSHPDSSSMPGTSWITLSTFYHPSVRRYFTVNYGKDPLTGYSGELWSLRKNPLKTSIDKWYDARDDKARQEDVRHPYTTRDAKGKIIESQGDFYKKLKELYPADDSKTFMPGEERLEGDEYTMTNTVNEIFEKIPGFAGASGIRTTTKQMEMTRYIPPPTLGVRELAKLGESPDFGTLIKQGRADLKNGTEVWINNGDEEAAQIIKSVIGLNGGAD